MYIILICKFYEKVLQIKSNFTYINFIHILNKTLINICAQVHLDPLTCLKVVYLKTVVK